MENASLDHHALQDYQTEPTLPERVEMQNMRAMAFLEAERAAISGSEPREGPVLKVVSTISRDGTAGSEREHDGNLATHFQRHDQAIEAMIATEAIEAMNAIEAIIPITADDREELAALELELSYLDGFVDQDQNPVLQDLEGLPSPIFESSEIPEASNEAPMGLLGVSNEEQHESADAEIMDVTTKYPGQPHLPTSVARTSHPEVVHRVPEERPVSPQSSPLGSESEKQAMDQASICRDNLKAHVDHHDRTTTLDDPQELCITCEQDTGIPSRPRNCSSFEEIYAVVCSLRHHALLYRDCPTIHTDSISSSEKIIGSNIRSQKQLKRQFAAGYSPINADLGQYIKRRPWLAVLLLRVVHCPEATEPKDIVMEDSDWTQSRELHADAKPYLVIISPILLKALTGLSKYDIPDRTTLPMSVVGSSTSLGIIEQTGFYYHHHKELQDLAMTSLNRQRSDPYLALSEGLHCVGTQWNDECTEARTMHANGEVTVTSLQQLFHPGMAIVTRPSSDKGEPVVCFVESYTGGILACWKWNFGGAKFHRQDLNVAMKIPNNGRTRIIDLEAFPLSYAPQELINDLERRARISWRLRHQSYVNYCGWDANDDRMYRSERFIVDTNTHRRMHHDQTTRPASKHAGSTQSIPLEIPLNAPMPSGPALLALPAIVKGFNLQDKKWYLLRVKNIGAIRYNKSAFQRLVLPADTKELVQALIETQSMVETAGDVIAGKGNGLILLLHGGPGTGKTLTAESVAEIAEKPLYRVTCGDIGTDPEEVEKYLDTVFYLGKVWNCIVLLDEADIFLEGRDLNDLARNSLVSVFLRTLEYFEGILILTTNRVGTFDEAFKSRIQVALHYPDLTPKVRKQIWQNLLGMLKDDEALDADIDGILDHMNDLKTAELNGRQIRDAINTSRRLALFRKEALAWGHVSQVVRIVGQFAQYLEKTHKHKDADRARELEWRA